MKSILKALLLVLAVAGIVGCSKKNNSSPYQTAIVGKWKYTADTVTYYYNGTLNSIIPGSVGLNDSYEFNSNGTGVKFISNTLVSFTYSLAGSQLTINLSAYAINTTEYPATIESATVNSLNATEMSLYFDSHVLDENGLDYETQEHAYFNKQ